jgi:hypothetical protein
MHRLTRHRTGRMAAAVLALAVLLPVLGAATVSAATTSAAKASAAGVPNRTFSCAGSLGDPFSAYTVTGSLTKAGTPYAVTTTQTATGAVVTRAAKAVSLGASVLHAGYTSWDITAVNPDGDTYALHVAAVLPGNGGYFDADLEVGFAGGTNGSLQIPMFDCTVTGGPPRLSSPAGARTFACTGGLGLVRTFRTVTGTLNASSRPSRVVVTETATAIVLSSRTHAGAAAGPSWLHAGYTTWNVTGANAAGDLYFLHVPAVLPAKGGFFDADLEIQFAGGAFGNWQIPMFDCVVA